MLYVLCTPTLSYYYGWLNYEYNDTTMTTPGVASQMNK